MVNKKAKIIKIVLAVLLWLSSLSIIFTFTSYNVDDSRQMSLSVAQCIEDTVAKHFYVNHNDEFWDKTLHSMIRKFGHLAEFSYLGFTTGILFVTLLKKRWLAFMLSAAACSVIAISDEYRQHFIPGRGPQWSDVMIDCIGALLGLIAFFIIFVIYSRIKLQKQRIRELEAEKSGLSQATLEHEPGDCSSASQSDEKCDEAI